MSACFIDYEKAFDRVNHVKMIQCLQDIGIEGKDLRLIKNLYWSQKAFVRSANGYSAPIDIKRGVRQGCLLSPCLFNLYTERIFRSAEGKRGISIGGTNLNNLRYADDTVLLAECEEDLQEIVNTINDKGKEYGMKMNAKKTKTMIISKKDKQTDVKITIDGVAIEQVHSFTYLGQLIKDNGRCEEEVLRRIGIAKSAFNSMSSTLTSRSISTRTRLRLVKCYVFSTLYYGCETWTLNKKLLSRLDAFEMWMYRKMLKVPWTRKETNKNILKKIGTKMEVLSSVRKRKVVYFGHMIRRDGFQRMLLEGYIEGKRSRGRPRVTWMKNILKWTGMSYVGCVRRAEDRYSWRKVASNLLDEDGT